MTSNHPLKVWDFNGPKECINQEDLIDWLKREGIQWAFQLEQGETGYIHWQGRINLKKKVRSMCGNINKKIRWSPTSNDGVSTKFSYVLKEETRIEGPWADTDQIKYVPRQFREITELMPWQQSIIEDSKIWNTRNINVIYCPEGNQGKSTLIGYMSVHGLGCKVPFCNDYKDIMRMIYGMETSKCYMIDMPRAINKERLYQLYGAIEEIKGGYAYDDRYSFKTKWFDCPNIYVFTNELPDLGLLSKDRWIIWTIRNNSLQRASPEEFKALRCNIILNSPEHRNKTLNEAIQEAKTLQQLEEHLRNDAELQHI